MVDREEYEDIEDILNPKKLNVSKLFVKHSKLKRDEQFKKNSGSSKYNKKDNSASLEQAYLNNKKNKKKLY